MQPTTQSAPPPATLTPTQRRTIAGGTIGTLMEYFDYYLYGLASAAVFPAVFFSSDSAFVAQLSSFATFAVGFLLRPVGGLVFGYIGDRFGRKLTLMITVIGMGLTTAAIGLIPSDASIGLAAPVLLVTARMFQGLFVGGEMGGAATMVVEHAPVGRRGLFGALLISGAGIANVASAGMMAGLGAGPESFFMTWGWRIPFLFALVLAIVAVILRRHLEESEEFTQHRSDVAAQKVAAPSPLREVLRHPKNAILGILIGLPQSIAGYVVLTFGLAFMVSDGVPAQVGFIGTMIVGALQIVLAPTYGALSDRLGRQRVYIAGCLGFALLVWPAFALYGTHEPVLIWLGMIVGFAIPGIAMQGTLQTMLTEMFDVEQRTTGVNIGYQLSNTLGGGLAPLIATALVGWAGGSIWPVVVYVVVISAVGAIATATASMRPDTADAGRLNALRGS
ncbi:MFS transporter [Brachybacterium fresconis]|uniref:MHS family shikimate/dehydroshikimate transporter-like MFS transporter n=1 Tax=Brachybacterium fresconis TaxID=173363 RepID=A0ABS4YNM5_9MICO|nr:MFS transporter [Brachybacterium fresconis]MBP2410120.1 MHS family shikimate/dehydroshikimate transporter-like MFS transporter [Brachybacterium fresconis]